MVYYVWTWCVPLFAFFCLAHVIMKKEVPHVELYILINTMLGYANLNYFLLDELKRYMLYNHYNIGDFVIFNSSYLWYRTAPWVGFLGRFVECLYHGVFINNSTNDTKLSWTPFAFDCSDNSFERETRSSSFWPRSSIFSSVSDTICFVSSNSFWTEEEVSRS